MKVFDVTNVIITEDKLVAALYDGRYDSIMVIMPKKDGEGNLFLEESEPDGFDRYYWLEKFGLLPEEELNEIMSNLQTSKDRKDAYEKLKLEFDAPRAARLDDKEKELNAKEKELIDWEKKLTEE